MKKITSAFVLFSLAACNSSESGIQKTSDSTQNVVDSQKYETKDSVAYKADTNKKVIDSTMEIMKDSLAGTRK